MDTASLGVLVQIALRNLVASRLKTAILGGIILFGTLLIVVGGSLARAMEVGMQKSIQSSVAGQIQIYSARSKDELAIWGSMGGGDPDLAAIGDFEAVKAALMEVDNVDEVVPMGISGAIIQSGNTIDVVLGELRDAVNRRAEGDASADAEVKSLAAHVRQMVQVLSADMDNLKVLVVQDAERDAALAYLKRASSPALWEEFEADPYGVLEFLENRIAPLAVDADMLFIRYVGTDTETFSKTFDRMEIVDGGPIPPGQRGLLFPKLFYEERTKLKSARRLDRIQAARENGRTIAADAELQRFVKENQTQVKEIVLQLDPIKTAKMKALLAEEVGAPADADLPASLSTFFDTDDANFDERYAFFYDHMAPLLTLYRIPVGQVLTIKAFTRSGFVKSVNVKVYGTYEFKGLEKSALASGMCLMDIISFRELYGYLTADKIEEIEALKKEAGVVQISREDAEAALFGGEEPIVADATAGIIKTDEALGAVARELHTEDLIQRVYSQQEIDDGVVLNAAVILKDKDAIPETLQAIQAVSDAKGLGLKVVSWQQAAGLVGQMVTMFKLVLYVVVFIIFVVALVIMNNAMMMATLERVREIGTLRAIGAQRGFVLRMILVETLVLGAVFGILGLVVGSAVVYAIGQAGIPAFTDVMTFFFSGARLYPTVAESTLVTAFIIITLVSLAAAFYPAWLATRISPLQAMQTED